MNETREETFHYSTKVPPGQRGCIFVIIGIMGIAIIFMFGSAAYLFINAGFVDDDSTFVGDVIIGVIVTGGGFLPLIGFIILLIAMMREKTYFEEHLVYDDKIIYQEVFPKEKKKTTEKSLPFSEMNWSLIGNNTRFVSGKIKGPPSYFQNEALLLLNFQEDIHILRLTEKEELNKWIDFLKERGLSVYYINHNLSNVFQHKNQIDFDTIEMTHWDDSKGQRPVFEETLDKAFKDWDPPYKNKDV